MENQIQNIAGSSIFIPGWKNETILIEIPPLQYKQCFVAYLDILGFKELVLKNKNEKIAEYFYQIEYRIEKLKSIELTKNIESIIISDSVILSLEMGESEPERMVNFRQFCIAVRDIQLNLATHNLLLRGGISFGDAHVKNNNIVGKAFQNSYLLGAKKAIFPRVIVDPSIVNFLFPNHNSQDLIEKINRTNEKNRNINKVVFFDWGASNLNSSIFIRDTPFFIDYLYSCVENVEQLRKIIQTVEQNIYSDQEIYTKYRWVVDYLKTCCRRYTGKNKIISKDLQQLFQIIERY